MESSRVLDERFGVLSPDAEVGVVIKVVAEVFSDLHLSVRVKKHEKTLESNDYGTLGGLMTLEIDDLLLLGVSQGHAKLIIRALFPPSLQPAPPPSPPSPTRTVVPDSPFSSSPPRVRSGPEFCELSATGAPTSKGFRAWIITFMVFIRQYVEESTLTAIQVAASNPLVVGAEWLLPCAQGQIVFDMLVGCGSKGLPPDLLLAFPPEIVGKALGVAALAFISRQVLVVTDEGAAVLQAWFSSPPPVTKKWMLGPALVQWLRTLEQLDACDNTQSVVSKRLSLFHLVSKIPELIPEIAALRVAAGAAGIEISKLIDLVRAKGEAFNSEKQTQLAVANMCFAGVADATDVDETKIPCRFWKLGTCRWGARCKWLHDGPAGIATVAKRHPTRERKTNKKSGTHDLRAAADLKAMLLELLSGIATDFECTVQRVLTKICGRWQSLQQFQKSSQISVAVVPPVSQIPKVSNCMLADQTADGRTGDSVSPTAKAVSQLSDSQSQILPNSQIQKLPRSEHRLNPIGPCDVKAETSMVLSKTSMDIPFNKLTSLQESSCLNTKIIKDIDVEPFADAVVELAEPPPVLRTEGMVSADIPASSVVCLGSGMLPTALASCWETAVVGDTGATVAIIGKQHVHLAVNIRLLPSPISVSTASGVIELTHSGDLPGCFGLMDGAYLNPQCAHSLCPVVQRCETLGVGFTVSEGAASASFHKDGKTLVDLDVSSGLPTFRVGGSSGTPALSAKSALMALAFIVTGTAASVEYQEPSCLVSAKQPSWMLEHDLSGHRPARPDCPYCKQAGLRESRAFRVPHSHRADESGYHLAGDFSGPHTPSVDGHTYAFIGVESTSSWGFVWLQSSRSAVDTLVSLKEFVRQLYVRAGAAVKSVLSWHHDDDKSFRGPVEQYVQSQGWADTHTGGYRPNANSLVERRVGMLHQSFRTLLLRATGGNTYYEQLWGSGLTQANKIINSGPWSDRPSPDSSLAGQVVPVSTDRHSFGCYCLFKIPKELRTGKWQPSSEKGIWVGYSSDVSHGHLVIPIEWNSTTGTWILYPTVTATSIAVYDTIFPLRMGPSASSTVSADFDTFVDAVFEPYLTEAVELQPVTATVPETATEPDSPSSSEDEADGFEVEKIKKKRVKSGQVQYLVKWAGWNGRFNRWVSIDDLQCDELIQSFESRQSKSALVATPFTALECEAVVTAQSSQLFGVDDAEAIKAVEQCMRKQKLEGTAAEFLPGYKTEIQQMLRRRLRLLGPAEATRVSREYSLGKLRMILELKRDGRKKARLILQGFREPVEWDEGSVASPVAFTSTLRMLLFTAGLRSDVISVNDVSVAFLQSDPLPRRSGP